MARARQNGDEYKIGWPTFTIWINSSREVLPWLRCVFCVWPDLHYICSERFNLVRTMHIYDVVYDNIIIWSWCALKTQMRHTRRHNFLITPGYFELLVTRRGSNAQCYVQSFIYACCRELFFFFHFAIPLSLWNIIEKFPIKSSCLLCAVALAAGDRKSFA